jgi:predicted Zn-dependent protease
MNQQQLTLIIGSVAMVLVLFFGFKTTPPKQKLIETSRAENVDTEKLQNAVHDATDALPETLRKHIQGLENLVKGSPNDSVKADALQKISAAWFDQGLSVPAGHAAERAAQILQSAEAWGIAGSTYGSTLGRDADQATAELAMTGAVRCFENAISMDPQNTDYRINLAICYAEQPPADNPMKGIQLLLDLNRNQPDNTSVLFHLARFGMRTGQHEKAKERLLRALEIDPEQRRLHCLMAELLTQTGEPEAEEYRTKCETSGN